MNLKYYSQSGFTLLEILLVVAIIAVISGFSVPIYETLKNKNDLNLGVIISVNALRRASEIAAASDGDTSWGVKFTTSSIILFKGGSYQTRDQNFDENSDLSSDIAVSETSEVVFQKFSGAPLAETTTTLTSSNGEVTKIHVNQKGAVEY